MISEAVLTTQRVSPCGSPKSTDSMHARYFSSNLGRLLSVDPVGGEVDSSQNWNRYSYALNNPLHFVDPSGMSEEEDKDEDEERPAPRDLGEFNTQFEQDSDNFSFSENFRVTSAMGFGPKAAGYIGIEGLAHFSLDTTRWAEGEATLQGQYICGAAATMASTFDLMSFSLLFGPYTKQVWTAEHGFDLLQNDATFSLGVMFAFWGIGVEVDVDPIHESIFEFILENPPNITLRR